LCATAFASFGPAARADFLFTHGDHTYLVVTTPTPWREAAAAARALNFGGQTGYLAHIDDAAENAAIAAQLLAHITAADFPLSRATDAGYGSYVWIGAQDITLEGNWIWDGDFDGVGPLIGTGTFSTWVTAPGAYQNWGINPATGLQREPDNGFGNQNAAGISLNGWPFGTPGQWNDVNDANPLYYVVEFTTAVPEPPSVALLIRRPCGPGDLSALAAHPHHEIVLGVEKLHQRPLHPPVAQALRDVDLLLCERAGAR